MNIYLDIDGSKVDIKEMPTILACGYTGCGKSTLLKKFWKQLSLNYRGKIKFVFIDLKAVEWTNIIESEKLFEICTTSEKADEIVDALLTTKYESPVFVFWDTFEDYLFLNNETLDKFKRLLLEGPRNNIYTVAASSRVDYGEKYVNLFKAVFLGNWQEDNYAFLDDDSKDLLKNFTTKPDSLKPGEFLMITDNYVKKINN